MTATGALVAVRFLNESLHQRREIVRSFKREAEIMKALSGDSTPRVVEPAVLENGSYYYVIDYLEEATTLDQVIKNSEVPVARKLGLLGDAAGALHTFHEQGFIHGDVTPRNIIVKGRYGGVQLIDFGGVRKIGPSDYSEPITFTYAYAAPEILALNHSKSQESQSGYVPLYAHLEIGPWLDIYPLGIMLFQALDPGLGRLSQMDKSSLLAQLVVGPELNVSDRRLSSSWRWKGL